MKGNREMSRGMKETVWWRGLECQAEEFGSHDRLSLLLFEIGVPVEWSVWALASAVPRGPLTLPVLAHCHSMQICCLSPEDVKDTGTCCFTECLQKSQSEQILVQGPPSAPLSFQIRRNIPDCSGICCPLCSSLFHSSGQKRARVEIFMFKVGGREERKIEIF